MEGKRSANRHDEIQSMSRARQRVRTNSMAPPPSVLGRRGAEDNLIRRRIRQRLNSFGVPLQAAPVPMFGNEADRLAAFNHDVNAAEEEKHPAAAAAAEDPVHADADGAAREAHWATAGRSYRRALIGNTGAVYPDRQRAEIMWFDMGVVYSGTTVSTTHMDFVLNSPNDPQDSTVVGQGGGVATKKSWSGSLTAADTLQPVGHSGLGILYDRYRVDSAEIEISTISTLNHLFCGFQVFANDLAEQDKLPVLLGDWAWWLVPYVDGPFRMPMRDSGEKWVTWRKHIPMNKVVGKSYSDFQDTVGYSADIGSDPAKLIKVRMFCKNQDMGSTKVQFNYTVRIKYHVTYFNIKQITRPAALSTGALTQGQELVIVDPNA